MSIHLQKEMEYLKKRILSLSEIVEKSVQKAVTSVQEKNAAAAKKVIEADLEIDHAEVMIEDECLKIVALYQPVAIDLRFIVAVLKINNDLERIGDLAVNIAERSVFLSEMEEKEVPFDFKGMAGKVQTMLRKSLRALVDMDPLLAREVCTADDEVDEINKKMYEQVKNGIRKNLADVDFLIHLLSISRHLERIADHATNIAEDVIYMVEGEIIRHSTEDFKTHGKQ